MPTNTTTYSFQKPVVGADEDSWGGYLNSNWDKVDDLFDGTTAITGIDINSGTIDGTVIGGSSAAAGTFTTLTANTSITGTLATAAQPNITSVGSLTSLDVAGTLTSDGLTVDNISLDGNTLSTTSSFLLIQPATSIVADSPSSTVNLRTASLDRLVVSNNGDISFYEDTGTTAKFFWDASAESLGIGTSSPTTILEVKGTSSSPSISITGPNTGSSTLNLGDADDINIQRIISDHTNDSLQIHTNNAERMRIDSSGNVGIGTSSPVVASGTTSLTIYNATASALYLQNSTTGTASTDGSTIQVVGADLTITNRESGYVRFNTANTERMRIDSSGNVGIGTSVPSAKAHILNTGVSTTKGDVYLGKFSSSGLGAGYYHEIGFGNNSTQPPASIGFISTLGSGGTLGDLIFSTRSTTTGTDVPTERMRIDSSGNVGIGTSSPAYKLQVKGDNSASGGILLQGTAGSYGLQIYHNGPADTSYIYNYYAGPLTFGTNNVERMRIDSSGRVMIGTTTEGQVQAENLTIADSGNMGMTLRSTDSGETSIFFSDGTSGAAEYAGWLQYVHPTDVMTFGVNAIERMRIDSSGNLLVGTTSNSITGAKTQIDSSTSAGLGLYNSGNAGYAILYVRTDGTNNYLAYWNYQGSAVGSVTTNGTSTSYNTTSDYRLKEDVQPMTGASDRVLALNPVNFAWKSDGSRVDGFLAHEAQEVVPEAVTGERDAVDSEGNPVYQGIDQSKLVPLLTAALQEALTKIDALETRIAALEGN